MNSLTQKGITTLADLLRRYALLDDNQKFVAMIAFYEARCSEARDLLLREIASANARISGVASVALGRICDRDALEGLSKVIRKRRCDGYFYNAISAVCNVHSRHLKEDAAGILVSILEVAGSRDEFGRSLAAEGLGRLLRRGRRGSGVFMRGSEVLVRALSDPCAEVRCSAVYSVGQLRIREAYDKLLELSRSDFAVCAGIGTVADEAKAAILEWAQVG